MLHIRSNCPSGIEKIKPGMHLALDHKELVDNNGYKRALSLPTCLMG
jgi:hypothetical protein